jgi:WD40 repeat protein
MLLDRVVPVIRFVGGVRHVGSGYRVSGNYVLTAAHCVSGRGHRVWLSDGERSAEVVADGGREAGLALLEIVPAGAEKPVLPVGRTRCAFIDRRGAGVIRECVAVGYPHFAQRPHAPFITGQVDGWIPVGAGLEDTPAGRRAAFLTLKARGPVPRALPREAAELTGSVWAGMSGAAVFAGDLLVGVVAEHHLPEGDGSLTVVSVESVRLMSGPGRARLTQALGLDRAVPRLAGARRQWGSVVPACPSAFVGRPAVETQLRQALLESQGAPVLLAGTGGAGKSVLAAHLARIIKAGGDAELDHAYPDGVAWVRVGRDRPVEAVQLELARGLGEDRPDLGGDWSSGRARLQELTQGKRGLLILDDVWSQERYAPFNVASPDIQILITTRNQVLAGDLGGTPVSVGELDEDQSRRLLAAASGSFEYDQVPGEAAQVLQEVGNLALGVAMLGGMARQHGPQSWPALLRRLRERRLDKIAHRFADDYEHATLLRAVEVAVEDLDPDDRQRWAELAVFAGQADFPEQALAALWQPFDEDELDTKDRARRLLSRSLLLQAGDGRYRLHDLQQDVAAVRLGPDGLRDTHARFMAAYAQRVAAALPRPARAAWTDLIAALAALRRDDPGWAAADDGYLLHHLIPHLCAAGQTAQAAALLADYNWLGVSVARRGMAELTRDYEELPGRASLDVIRDALVRSWRPLESDPSCLPDQLIGRLAGRPEPDLRALLRQAKAVPRPLEIIRSGLERPSGALMRRLTGPEDAVVVAVTPDETKAVTGNSDGSATVWDLATGKQLRVLRGHNEIIWHLAVLGDGARVVTADSGGKCVVWDLDSGASLLTFHGPSVDDLAVTPDGTLAVTSGDGKALVWDMQTGELLHTLRMHPKDYDNPGLVAVMPDGKRLLTATFEGRGLIVWDLASGTRIHTLSGHRSGISAIKVFPDGARAVSGDFDGKAIVWDLARGRRLSSLRGHGGRHAMIHALAVSGDGNRVITASEDATAIIWDLSSTPKPRRLFGHPSGICAVMVTDDEKVVTCSSDRTVIYWDLHTGELLRAIATEQSYGPGSVDLFSVGSVVLLGGGARMITVASDASLLMWDLSRAPRSFSGKIHVGNSGVSVLAAAADGRRAISAGGGMTAVWDTASGEPLIEVEQAGPGYIVTAADFVAARENQAVSVSPDGMILLWDTLSGVSIKSSRGWQAYAPRIVLSRQANRMVVCESGDRKHSVWDLLSGERVSVFRGTASYSSTAVMTSAGDTVISAMQENGVFVWDAATGEQMHSLPGLGERVCELAVTWDDSRVVTGNTDGSLSVWKIASGERLLEIPAGTEGRRSSVEQLSLSCDDGYAVVGYSDGSVTVWDLADGRRLHGLPAHRYRATALAIDDSSTFVVTVGSGDERAFLSDLKTGRLLATWHGDTTFGCAVWIAGQRSFMLGDTDGDIHLLRLRQRG